MSSAHPTMPPGFDDLTAEQQIDYVQLLWDRIVAHPARLPVPSWHQEVLAERLSDLESNPDAERSWEEVRADFRTRIDKTQ